MRAPRLHRILLGSPTDKSDGLPWLSLAGRMWGRSSGCSLEVMVLRRSVAWGIREEGGIESQPDSSSPSDAV